MTMTMTDTITKPARTKKPAKVKKSDLRYGDVIRFTEGAVSFGSGSNMLGERRPAFSEDTFTVDWNKPGRGKKLPTLELRPVSRPKYSYDPKGAFPAFEIVSRLPEDVQVFKTNSKNFGGMIHFTTILIGKDGESRDDRAVAAEQAMDAARALGCAVVVFKSFGYAEVWPWPEGVPPFEFIQKNVEDPYDTAAVADTSRLNPEVMPKGIYEGPYLAYTGDNGLLVDKPVMNGTAQFALLNNPEQHRELQQHEWINGEMVENPDFYFGRYAGGVVVLVGFSIDSNGETIRTPIEGS